MDVKHFNASFNNISVLNASCFVAAGNWITLRKPLTSDLSTQVCKLYQVHPATSRSKSHIHIQYTYIVGKYKIYLYEL